jgi:hypothetical protein
LLNSSDPLTFFAGSDKQAIAAAWALASLSWHADEIKAAVAAVPQCVPLLVGHGSRCIVPACVTLMHLSQLPAAQAQMQPLLPPGTDDPQEYWCKRFLGLV